MTMMNDDDDDDFDDDDDDDTGDDDSDDDGQNDVDDGYYDYDDAVPQVQRNHEPILGQTVLPKLSKHERMHANLPRYTRFSHLL